MPMPMANGTSRQIAEINQRRADGGGQQRVAGKAKQIKRDARFPDALRRAIAVGSSPSERMSQADWKLRAATSTLAVATTIADNGHSGEHETRARR